MNVSMIICTNNRPEELAICLHSMEAQISKPYEVIIVDDDLPNQTAEPVAKEFIRHGKLKINYIINNYGVKWPATRNIGVRAAAADIFAFIDDDVILPPNWLTEIIKCYEETGADGVGGCTYNLIPFTDGNSSKTPFADGFSYRFISAIRPLFFYHKLGKLNPLGFAWAPVNLPVNRYKPVDYFLGSNMTFRREVFRLYEFDASYQGTGYADELDFCTKLTRQGKKRLVYSPQAVAIHARVQSGGARMPDRLYWLFRNHTLYLLKNFNLRYFRVGMLAFLVSIYSLFTLKPTYVKAIRDGIRQYRSSSKALGTKGKIEGSFQ